MGKTKERPMIRDPGGRKPSNRGRRGRRSRWASSLLPFLAFLSLALAAALGLGLFGVARGQQVHRNGFEGRSTAWVKGAADAGYRENKHLITDLVAHGGQKSEYLQLTAEQGSYIHYQYPTRRALVSDELSASVWVKANRPGVQLLARLVLPHERNPSSLDDCLTTMLRGDLLRAAGSWQRLELRRPVELVRQQQNLMQASLKRPINVKDAYIDALILNVYGGPGHTEVWIDDLELGPLLDPTGPFQTTGQPAPADGGAPRAGREKVSRPVLVEHTQDQLLVGGKRFFLRGIRHSDTPLPVLREAGFNALWVDATTSPTLLQQAVDLGFWLVPSLPLGADDRQLVSTENLNREVTHFPAGDAVLLWDVGGALTREQADAVTRSVQAVRGADPGRPIGGDVWDGFLPYSRSLDLVGAHRWPLMTTLELPRYREWLNQRRLLANPGTFMWTWVQTHLPDWYVQLVYDQSSAAGFQEPIGPQPEQIRLVTYTALAAGCRGLGFWSDRFLADSHQGRDRLQALALLNQELDMLEPLLLAVDDPPVWIDTSVPDVKAAVLRSPRGVLVLPMWLGGGAQFVPGQAAVSKLSMVVPQVPQGTTAWEVSPGEVRGLKPERVAMGYKITLPEFGLTGAVVFTADNALVVRFQEQCRARRQLAAQWTRDLAQLELAKALRVEQQLEQAGHTLPDGAQLVKNAQERLRRCEELWNNHLYTDAYLEAQRALRPVRIMMRAQWEQAVRGLDTPVATPYAVSFFTLPRHWKLMDEVRRLTPGANVLLDGNFETELSKRMEAWIRQDLTLDEVDLVARRVTEVRLDPPKPPGTPGTPGTPAAAPATPAAPILRTGLTSPAPAATPAVQVPGPPLTDRPGEGKQCLMLEIKPKNPLQPPAALQRTFLGIHTPAVKLPPGTWVQISGMVRIPSPITASADGALLYDSAAGEPFAIRLTDPLPWKRFTLYRRVPATGVIHVTLALTGLGRVYFDDIRIQPLTPPASNTTMKQVQNRSGS
jgi:hypothetical protein